MKTDEETDKCRCGHTKTNHSWEYVEPVYFSRWEISPAEQRLNCNLCKCEKFNPPLNHKAKWFGIGIGIIVVVIIIKAFLN